MDLVHEFAHLRAQIRVLENRAAAVRAAILQAGPPVQEELFAPRPGWSDEEMDLVEPFED